MVDKNSLYNNYNNNNNYNYNYNYNPFTCLKTNKCQKKKTKIKKWLELLVLKGQDINEAGYNGQGININSISKEMISRGMNLDMVARFQNCVRYSIKMTCVNCGTKSYHAFHCDNRLCPVCFARRYSKIKKKYWRGIKAMRYPKLITVGCGKIYRLDGAEIAYFRKKLHQMMKKFMRKISKGFIVVEISPNYYLHFHAIIDTKCKIPQNELSAAWESLTGRYIVDMKMVRSPKKALNYITKYICKVPTFQSTADYVNYYQIIKKRRMFSAIGKLYNKEDELEVVSVVSKCPECGYEMEFYGIGFVEHGWMQEYEEWWRSPADVEKVEVKQC